MDHKLNQSFLHSCVALFISFQYEKIVHHQFIVKSQAGLVRSKSRFNPF